ncbi:hypothetical protein [Spirosoma spitsbergense]|uniref:hypothetical protein n=1 Tax=Spirosoma spitsbergense TaxID=431554 RepID=UPI000362EEB0|nr:hypothetical protein [Spirosoma spitsbergense]
MGIFSPVRPFTNAGQRYSGGLFIGSGGDWLINSRALTIRPVGSYTTDGVVSGASGNYHDIVVTSGSKGRWQWSGYCLTMTDCNGRSSRVITFPIGKGLALHRRYFIRTEVS